MTARDVFCCFFSNCGVAHLVVQMMGGGRVGFLASCGLASARVLSSCGSKAGGREKERRTDRQEGEVIGQMSGNKRNI